MLEKPDIALMPVDQLPAVLDTIQAAEILRCSARSVEEALRSGQLPGHKWGESWILPSRAFIDRINEHAAEAATERRLPPVRPAPAPWSQRRKSGRPPPRLDP